jgi:hypothetical protein
MQGLCKCRGLEGQIFFQSIHTQIIVLFYISILQGNLQHEYAGSDCVQLCGCETLSELTELLRYLNLCFYFSKKPFPAFLEFGGYDQDSVLLHMPKARVRKYRAMIFFFFLLCGCIMVFCTTRFL